MARRVKLDVDVNMAAANAKLKLFEVRALRALDFGATGRPSTTPFAVQAPAVIPRRPGQGVVIRSDTLGRAQFTLSSPADQTARALGTAAHLAQGSRIAGLNRAIQESVAIKAPRAVASAALGERIAGATTADLLSAKQITREVFAEMGLEFNDFQVGSLDDIAQLERFKQRRFQFEPVQKKAGRLRRLHNRLSSKALPAGALGTFGKIRSGFEVAGAGGITSRTTVAGLAVATFAYVRVVSGVRNRLLREAAESGDPTTFSYGAVAEEGAVQFGLSVNNIRLSAGILSATTALTLVEGLGQLGIHAVGGLAAILPGLDTGSTNFRNISRNFSEWTGATIAAADGSELKRQAIFKGKQDTWSRGFDEVVFRAGIFKEKVVKARAAQALALGFNFGSLGDVEDTIAAEIGSKIHAAAINEYEATHPYPWQHAQTGKKE